MARWNADDGTEINYEIYGDDDKPTLLLLPGLLGAISNQWRPFVKPLTADFRVVLMDLRGHGHSGNAVDELNLETMVIDVNGLLDALGVATVHISGYSLGGYLGLMLALREPRLVSTLLIHATKFFWTQAAAETIHAQLDPDMMAQKVPTYADQLVQDHGARQWRNLVRQVADLVTYMVDNGVTENMVTRLQCPVLVSVGDRDELVPVIEALRLARVLPKGELIVLPGVHHPFQTIRAMPLLPMMQYFHKNS